MSVRVVTNNAKVSDAINGLGFEVVFCQKSAEATLLQARNMLFDGWRLCADPLAGYKIRFNPYHTVFLCNDEQRDISYDVLRLERAASHMCSPRRPAWENTAEIRADYCELDLSIAKTTAQRLKLYY